MSCTCGRDYRIKEAEHWDKIVSIILNLPSDEYDPEFTEWVQEQALFIHDYLERNDCYCE